MRLKRCSTKRFFVQVLYVPQSQGASTVGHGCIITVAEQNTHCASGRCRCCCGWSQTCQIFSTPQTDGYFSKCHARFEFCLLRTALVHHGYEHIPRTANSIQRSTNKTLMTHSELHPVRKHVPCNLQSPVGCRQ
jgi:hypothetical protein